MPLPRKACVAPSNRTSTHVAITSLTIRPTTTRTRCARTQDDVSAGEALLEAGADPNLVDRFGWTALHVACANGYARFAYLLTSHEATDVDLYTPRFRTAVDLATDEFQVRGRREVRVCAGGFSNFTDGPCAPVALHPDDPVSSPGLVLGSASAGRGADLRRGGQARGGGSQVLRGDKTTTNATIVAGSVGSVDDLVCGLFGRVASLPNSRLFGGVIVVATGCAWERRLGRR